MLFTRVEWSEGGQALAALDAGWDELAVAGTPFARSAWLLPWLAAFSGRRRPAVCRVWQGSQLVAGVVLLISPGGRLTAPVNDHTPLFLPVARDAEGQGRLLDALAERAHGVLRVAGLPVEAEATAGLVAAGERLGRRTLVELAHVSPFVDLAPGAEAYRRAVRSRVAEHERRRRKLRREHDVAVLAVERPDDLGRQLEAGLALEATGWKGHQGTAVLSSPTTSAFYREVVRRHDEQGQLALSALWVDGELAAFDLALLADGRYHLLKTAYDEQRRRLGAGMVLRLDVLDRCFELGLDRHEFLGPDMAWKRVFATGARSHCAVSVFGRGAVGAAAGAYRRRARPLLRAAYRRAQPAVTHDG